MNLFFKYMSALFSVEMEDRNWMYSGRAGASQMSDEWLTKTLEFLEFAFAKNPGLTWCPCKCYKNQRRQTKDDMGFHLAKSGFMPD